MFVCGSVLHFFSGVVSFTVCIHLLPYSVRQQETAEAEMALSKYILISAAHLR